ncbi:MAG: ACT domain-containing protein [Bacillota bacterium]|nr:ACT domain-containing protein [Bacillota bacterium]
MRAIVTVIGRDKVGIIAAVSAVLAACNANILDISQTVLQEYFAMVMLCDLSKISVPFTELKRKLREKGEEIGLEIRIQREDIFNAMHRV